MHVPQIALVVARARNGVIGRDGALPWRLRSDLQRFKAVTLGKPCIMGRATWESLPLKPLPGRLNIVLTRDLSYEEQGLSKGALVCTNLDEAIEIARETAVDDDMHEICIIGGTALFEAVMPRAKRLYVTEVEAEPEGDALFPAFNEADWEETEAVVQAPGEKDDHAMVFRILERKSA
jgi:dihydrofolate reductase